MSYKKIDMHAKKSQALVVHCSDPRFQDAYRKVTDQLGHYYDLLVFPGASKAIADHSLVLDSIKLLHSLHSFDVVHIMDHVHCGAFGEVEDEVKDHAGYLKKAEQTLKTHLPDVQVKHYLLGEKGQLELTS